MGLDAEWEKGRTRWTLGVQNSGGRCRTHPFPAESTPSPKETEPAREGDPMVRGKLQEKREAPVTTESHKNEGSTHTTSEEQPGTLRTRSEAASTALEATVPSDGGEGSGRKE